MTRSQVRTVGPNLPVLLLTPLLFLSSGCGGDPDPTWTMVWSDEFEGPAGQLPNAANWAFDIGTDWGNAQLEYDTDRPENVSLDGNGNPSREHVSRCVYWLIGSQASEMPPELPQTCSCPRQRRLVAPPVLGACTERVAEAGDGQPGSRAHSKHYGTNARTIPGFTAESRRTER